MKKLNLLLFAILALGLVLTSCGDGGDNNDDGLTQAQRDSIAISAEAVAALDNAFSDDNNTTGSPNFASGTITPSGTDITANVTTNTAISTMAGSGTFFDDAAYKGAINPSGTPWYSGWSFYSELVKGNTGDVDRSSQLGTEVMITDDIDANTTWTSGNTYVLDGFIFVKDGAELTIEAGTVIKGKEMPTDANENASALIISTSGTIQANGTASSPIIFTFEKDNLDGTDEDGDAVDATVRGKWGGLIILGTAGLNSTPGTSQIEGIPTTVMEGAYGGSDDTDNSGTLRYVSIRHGGSDIGAGNEINGLSLGGVGSGTTIEYVEIIANEDDGFEWFGGTANGKWLISAFCGDDALDYDEGYRGFNQFVIVHQDPTANVGDRGGEHDGGTTPETGSPFATPYFVNVTSVGNSANRTITFRDNAGGFYINSIFTGYDRGIDVEAFSDGSQSSYLQFRNGNLAIMSSIFDVQRNEFVPTVVIK